MKIIDLSHFDVGSGLSDSVEKDGLWMANGRARDSLLSKIALHLHIKGWVPDVHRCGGFLLNTAEGFVLQRTFQLSSVHRLVDNCAVLEVAVLLSLINFVRQAFCVSFFSKDFSCLNVQEFQLRSGKTTFRSASCD